MLYTDATVTLDVPFFFTASATISAEACPNRSIASCTASLWGVAFNEYFFNKALNSSKSGAFLLLLFHKYNNYFRIDYICRIMTYS